MPLTSKAFRRAGAKAAPGAKAKRQARLGPGAGNMAAIAERIRATRKRKHVSLGALAAKAGLDKSYLSRIERGEKAPSVATLINIAAALDLQVGQLFGDSPSAEPVTVVRAREHLAMRDREGGKARFYETILPASDNRRMSVFLIDPSRLAPMEKVGHPGDELIFMLSGTMDVVFSDRVVTLAAGDVVHFAGGVRHEIRRTPGQTAKALVIVANDLEQARRERGKKG